MGYPLSGQEIANNNPLKTGRKGKSFFEIITGLFILKLHAIASNCNPQRYL